MKLVDMTCPHCGAHLQVNAELRQAWCAHCGASLLIDDEVQHVRYDNAEEVGYKFEKGRQRAQAEVNQSYNTVVNTSPAPKKKRRTWLWVLGWIFIFPLPLTILLLRKKDMKSVLKYGIIAVAWILYFVIALAGRSDNNMPVTETNNDIQSSTEITQQQGNHSDSENNAANTESEPQDSSEQPNELTKESVIEDFVTAFNVVSNTIDLYLIFMSPLVFYGCLKSNILLGMFKGNSYSEHSSVFIWTVLGIFIYGISLLLHKYYECIQKTNNILVINIIAAVFNIAANFVLIPILGFEAAALTTFLSYLLYAMIVWIRTHKQFPVKINVINLLKILGSIIIFYLIDRALIRSTSVIFFFAEGIIYVLYTAAMYQLLKVCDIKQVLTKVIKRRLT